MRISDWSSDVCSSDLHVIGFVLRCAEAFDLQGMWGFGWALTCSKPRLDGFGGGAHIIDLGARRTLVWIDCGHWLATRMDARVEPVSAVPAGSARDQTPALPSADQASSAKKNGKE